MKATARRDTPVELHIRHELHRKGYRYRVDARIPEVTRGRPDIVFRTEKIAVFVDGCFWHSCPEHATSPKTNHEWWVDKLRANVDRDRRHDDELEAAGWWVHRFWEHDDPVTSAATVAESVNARRYSRAGA